MTKGLLRRLRLPAVVIILLASLPACQPTANEIAKMLGAPPDTAVALRMLQTRRFNTLDEETLLAAATQTLQDLGYTISESSPKVGIVVAAKQRDAQETKQVVGQIALAILAAMLGSAHSPVWDQEQTINVTLVATPIENSKQIEVRVSFDRTLTNNHGIQWRAELLKDPDLYKQFFDRLSGGIFLVAQEI